jgi:hypothetical protein
MKIQKMAANIGPKMLPQDWLSREFGKNPDNFRKM